MNQNTIGRTRGATGLALELARTRPAELEAPS
jgi:hypothetical protein